MRTCGLDVHKDTIFCAIYDGKDAVVRKFDTFTPSIREMCGYISSQGVDTAGMESTGMYIDPIRTVLRENGMKAVVANPYLVRQMPGRKSDSKDAVWIAKLQHKRMLPSSFVPDTVLQELRTYTRAYAKFVQCAWGAVRTKGSKFQQQFGRLAARKSPKKAIVAVARKLLVTIYAMLLRHEGYRLDVADKAMDDKAIMRRLNYHMAQCLKLQRMAPKQDCTEEQDQTTAKRPGIFVADPVPLERGDSVCK